MRFFNWYDNHSVRSHRNKGVLLINDLKPSVFAVVPGCERWSQRSSGHPQHRHAPPIKQKAKHSIVYENSTICLWSVIFEQDFNIFLLLSPASVSVVYGICLVIIQNG
jgi:hypothetical protein